MYTYVWTCIKKSLTYGVYDKGRVFECLKTIDIKHYDTGVAMALVDHLARFGL